MSVRSTTTTDLDGFKIGRHVCFGVALALLLVVGIGGWSLLAQLSGAVVATGSVKVERNLKAIQHRDGGIISEIAVHEGDFVSQGQVLLRLDDVQTRAELSIIRSQIDELTARRARLVAERDLLTEVRFPDGFEASSPEAAAVAASEANLFRGDRIHRQSQKEQLELRIAQTEKEIGGLDSQRVAKVDEIRLVQSENSKLKDLFARGLIENMRIYTADREAARLMGSHGEVEAGIARANATISEIRLQVIAIDQTARTEAQRELTTVEAKIVRTPTIAASPSRTGWRAPTSAPPWRGT